MFSKAPFYLTKNRYLDIDVHHGDGVEEAFLTTNRVMTVSFHQYDEKEKFFPGTGAGEDVGASDGKYYAMNIPLRPGCDDESYHTIFPKIMDKVMETCFLELKKFFWKKIDFLCKKSRIF